MDRAISTVFSSLRRGLKRDASFHLFKVEVLMQKDTERVWTMDELVAYLVELTERAREASQSLVRGLIVFSHAKCKTPGMHPHWRCPQDQCEISGVVFYLES